jgi:hypothetical protein
MKGKFFPVFCRKSQENKSVEENKPIKEIEQNLNNIKVIEENKKPILSNTQINVIDLPSKFLSYPPNSYVKYRPYFFKEIKDHDFSKNLTYRDEVDFVLSGIYTNFDKYDLTLSDYLFLNLLRRISNTGDYDISVKYRCNTCGNMVMGVFKSNEIEIDYLKVPKLPIRIKFSSGKEYEFKPLTIGKYIELVEEKFKDKTISIISKCCINTSYEEIFNFISNIVDPIDIALIEYLDKQIYHNVKPMVLKCTHITKKYLEKDGWSKEKIEKLGDATILDDQIKALFDKYEIKFVEGTGMVQFAIQDLIKKMALIEEIPCNGVNSIELEGGDVFLGPFCDYDSIIKDRICYGP